MIIRRYPEDFRVRELLSSAFSRGIVPLAGGSPPAADHPHAVYILEKSSLTTPEATSQLAAAFKARAGLVEYAGLKDKHAVTSQHVSLNWASLKPDGPASSRIEPPPLRIDRERWNASLLGFSARPIAADCIDHNHFDIVVRGASRADVGEVRARARALARGDAPGRATIVNYFGDQRFGSARHAEGFIALHLVHARFEDALRLAIATPARKDTGKKRIFTRAAARHWGNFKSLAKALPACPERAAIETLAEGKGFKEAFAALPAFLQQISIEAYQSHLWNRIAARAATQGVTTAKVFTAEDDFGPLAFPSAAALPPGLLNLDLPLPAPDAVPPAQWRSTYDAVLAEDGVSLDRLKIPGMRRPFFGTASRPLLVDATNLELGKAEPDESASKTSPKNLKFSVSFDLPRGAYATIVLRALGQ